MAAATDPAPLALLVDDEVGILSTLSGVLADNGFATLTTGSGDEATELYRRHRPEVVFVDVWLPDRDGLETLGALREIDPRAAVVLISGHGTTSTAVRAIKMGAFDYLEKPVSYEQVRFAPGEETEAAFYNIAAMIGGNWLKVMLTIPAVLFAGIAGALTAQAATARLLYGMARDGQLPHLLAHVHPVRKVPDRAIFLIAAITLVLGMWLVDQLELLASMVSFGALLGFMMLHFAVMAHFLGREESRKWLRHLVAPSVGLAIVVYVLVNAHTEAKIAGTLWMVAGLGLFFGLKLAGRPTALPVEEPRAQL